MGGSKIVRPRIDEAAACRLPTDTRDDVHERRVGSEVVPQILEPRRWPVGVGSGPYGNHCLEVGVRLRARDREAGNSLNHGELLLEKWERQPDGCVTCEIGLDITPPPRSGACAAIVADPGIV